jgi:hypothetical protein
VAVVASGGPGDRWRRRIHCDRQELAGEPPRAVLDAAASCALRSQMIYSGARWFGARSHRFKARSTEQCEPGHPTTSAGWNAVERGRSFSEDVAPALPCSSDRRATRSHLSDQAIV